MVNVMWGDGRRYCRSTASISSANGFFLCIPVITNNSMTCECSQRFSNSPYPEQNQHKSSYWYLFLISFSHLRLGLLNGLFPVDRVLTLKFLVLRTFYFGNLVDIFSTLGISKYSSSRRRWSRGTVLALRS